MSTGWASFWSRGAALCVLAALAPLASALAVEAAIEAPAGTRVFEPGFFAADRPTTALDMVRRVPGFSLQSAEIQVRGLGAAQGNVLIDGQPPTAKGISLQDILAAIPAGNVARLELLEGAAAGAVGSGQSLVVNVVRKATATASTRVTAFAMAWDNGYVRPELELSTTREVAGFDVSLSLSAGVVDYDKFLGGEGLTGPNGELLEDGPNHDVRRTRDMGASLSAARSWGETALSLNAGLSQSDRTRRWFFTAARPGEPLPYRGAEGLSDAEDTELELGGSLSGPIWAGIEARGDLLYRRETELETDLATERQVGRTPSVERFVVDATTAETVGRLTLSRSFGAHRLEFGAEYARNTADFANTLAEGTSEASLRPVALGIANTEVAEDREEVFLVDTWTATPSLTVEGALRAESSTITQTGDARQTRSFTYVKPSAAVTWTASPTRTVRGSLTRDVGQLDFGAFADAADLTDNNANLGNPDLRPDQSWIARIEVEQRWGKQGSLTLGLVHQAIEDVLGLVPVDADRDGRFEGETLGNLPEATRWGFDVEARVPLDSVAEGLEVNLDARWRDSTLTDPLTGRDRMISGEDGRSLEFSITQTLAGGRWRWETWVYTGDRRVEIRRDQILQWGTNTFWGGWLAYRDPQGASWELGLENPGGNRFTRDRTDYLIDRADGRIEGGQYRFREIGPSVYLELTWNL